MPRSACGSFVEDATPSNGGMKDVWMEGWKDGRRMIEDSWT